MMLLCISTQGKRGAGRALGLDLVGSLEAGPQSGGFGLFLIGNSTVLTSLCP